MLDTPGFLEVHSTEELAEHVHRIRADKARRDESFRLGKRPEPVHLPFSKGFETRPVEVLHELGVATSFFRESPFADIAHLWARFRYCGTLGTNQSRKLVLAHTPEDVVYHHKMTQSEQLGVGFALVIAKRLLARWYPEFRFQAIDAEVALKAGYIQRVGRVVPTKISKKRPDYFLVGHNARGTKVKIFVLECKGTHEDKTFLHGQLAKACVQVQTIEIGEKKPRSLMIASLLKRDGISSYVLDPPGEEDLWSGEEADVPELLDGEPGEATLTARQPTFNDLVADSPEQSAQHAVPAQDADTPRLDDLDGAEEPASAPEIVRIADSDRPWFLGVLARSAAASALIFAGDVADARRYTTPRQRSTHVPEGNEQELFPADDFRDPPPDTALSTYRLPNGATFEGRSYTAPLWGHKVLRVRCGLESTLYRQLREGKVARYWRLTRGITRRLGLGNGPSTSDHVISIGGAGTVMAIDIENQ